MLMLNANVKYGTVPKFLFTNYTVSALKFYSDYNFKQTLNKCKKL
jgi:hypothetical protein